MKIHELIIHNWRSIKDTTILFEKMEIFIGQNNHGKSNILSALLFFFGEIECADLDYSTGTDDLFVEIDFKDLDEQDKIQFKKYLTREEHIRVRKSSKRNETFEYHGYYQIPNEEWLKEENVGNYLKRDEVETTPLKDYIPQQGRLSREDISNAQASYIKANKVEVKFNYKLEGNSFLGYKNVAKGIFGRVIYIPAVKDATEEFDSKGKSAFSDLLSDVIHEISSTNEEYKKAKEEISKLMRILNHKTEGGQENDKRPEQISNFENTINQELRKWRTTINIDIEVPDIERILKSGVAVSLDDGIATDLSRKGNGLQRLLIYIILKSWATTTRTSKLKEGGENDDNARRKTSDSNYIIFEEPELYLHPQSQRELFDSLKEISQHNFQVILSTHSSSFLDLSYHKSICKVYKNENTTGTKISQFTEELFASSDKERFNLTYWINPERSELFFANKTILVEGATEKTVIPFLAKTIDKFKFDYTIIDCGGKPNIKSYIHLLNRFRLPYVATYDIDHQNYKDQDAWNQADIVSREIEGDIDHSIGNYVTFQNDFEEEIGITDKNQKNKPYNALKKVSESNFQISPSLRRKIEIVFE